MVVRLMLILYESRSFITSEKGLKYNTIFVDECHDVIRCPPDRETTWISAAQKLGKRPWRMVLVSATLPPDITSKVLSKYDVKENKFTMIRGPTDRQNLGLHTVEVQGTEPQALGQLQSLVRGLKDRLEDEERMLVLFGSHTRLKEFQDLTGHPIYSSNLSPKDKSNNLGAWDAGHSQVLACTTAFVHGIDRSHVHFVVIFFPSFDLMVNVQMAGRAGRDNKPSHVFFVTPRGKRCNDKRLNDVINTLDCKVKKVMLLMDGPEYAYHCLMHSEARRVCCDRCAPDQEIKNYALACVANAIEKEKGQGFRSTSARSIAFDDEDSDGMFDELGVDFFKKLETLEKNASPDTVPPVSDIASCYNTTNLRNRGSTLHNPDSHSSCQLQCLHLRNEQTDCKMLANPDSRGRPNSTVL